MSKELEDVEEMVSGMNHNQISRAIYYRDCRIKALEEALESKCIAFADLCVFKRVSREGIRAEFDKWEQK